MSKYEMRKADARERAINWQSHCADENYSWGEMDRFYDYFYNLGKRYGLIRDFRENGII